MTTDLQRLLQDHRDPLYSVLRHLLELPSPFFSREDVRRVHRSLLGGPGAEGLEVAEVRTFLDRVQGGVVSSPIVHLALRESVARWRYLQIHAQEMTAREIGTSEFLQAQERVVLDRSGDPCYAVEVDLTPFERDMPKLESASRIGRGVQRLHEHLSRRLRDAGEGGRRALLEFLAQHSIDGRPLMLAEGDMSPDRVRARIDEAIALPDHELEEGGSEYRRLGFEAGWGNDAPSIREMLGLLGETLDDPTPDRLANFLRRIPLVFSVVIVSPHGYFGQANVLGKPDTGGQVVYILDQVRALEREMRRAIQDQGLAVEPEIVVLSRLIPEAGDTDCGLRLEPILGTERARILRVPFRTPEGAVVPQWISRFEVWPFLERFALDAEREILAELGGKPDVIIGNYSDGNLVASVMAHRLGVIQCNVAHALEKTKYAQSDVFWERMDPEYHFACQFTADLIAMNAADFIITSTYQEIAGTEETVGQYESYRSFTLPGLYRVPAGIDCLDTRFNIVSPGADSEVFFPADQLERRPKELRAEVEDLVYGQPVPGRSRGALAERGRPLLFAMSRLDPIKNMAALVRWYGNDAELRDHADLLLVGGQLDAEGSTDASERAEIERMHELIDRYGLEGRVRWLEMQTDKTRVGELYRFVADTRGAFVQPALFEAFGLTIVEAMGSGLPVFVTRNGGPLEIVEDGVSGFHIDPADDAGTIATMSSFLRLSAEDPERWDRVAEQAIRRIAARFTWERYAGEFLGLSRIYGFWRFLTDLERAETHRYLEMFYGLMYRPLAERVSDGTPI